MREKGLRNLIKSRRVKEEGGSCNLAQESFFIPTITPCCPLCDEADKTNFHLFFPCSLNQPLWQELGFNALVLSSHATFQQGIQYLLHQILEPEKKPLALFICWSTWLHRNKLIFKGLAHNIAKVKHYVIMLTNQISNVQSSGDMQCGQYRCARRLKPANVSMKMNIDAAWTDLHCAKGIILHNSGGMPILLRDM